MMSGGAKSSATKLKLRSLRSEEARVALQISRLPISTKRAPVLLPAIDAATMPVDVRELSTMEYPRPPVSCVDTSTKHVSRDPAVH